MYSLAQCPVAGTLYAASQYFEGYEWSQASKYKNVGTVWSVPVPLFGTLISEITVVPWCLGGTVPSPIITTLLVFGGTPAPYYEVIFYWEGLTGAYVKNYVVTYGTDDDSKTACDSTPGVGGTINTELKKEKEGIREAASHSLDRHHPN
jgi:hypothetical protein